MYRQKGKKTYFSHYKEGKKKTQHITAKTSANLSEKTTLRSK